MRDTQLARRVAAAAFALSLGLNPGTHAAVTPVAVTGDAAPVAGENFLDSLGVPLISDTGEVVFYAPTGSLFPFVIMDNIFLATPGSLTTVVRDGDATPDGGTFDVRNVDNVVINESGTVLFNSAIAGLGLIDNGLFRWRRLGGGGTEVISPALRFDPVPVAGGFIDSFGSRPTINSANQTVFTAAIETGVIPPEPTVNALLRGEADGSTIVQIARVGDAAPDESGTPDGTFAASGLGLPSINALGHTAFIGDLAGAASTEGIFLDNGTTLLRVVRTGQNAPDPNGTNMVNGTFGDFSGAGTPITLNDSGHLAFRANLLGTDNDGFDDAGIFIYNGTSVVQVAREGQTIAGAGMLLSSSAATAPTFNQPAFNNAGQAAFVADIFNAPNTASSGIFLGDGSSDPVPIVQSGQARPDDAEPFADFIFNGSAYMPSLTDTGQVLFQNVFVGSGTPERAFYLADDQEIIPVVRETDVLVQGKTVDTIAFVPDTSPDRGGRSSLNNHGQVAFRAIFTDATAGVFLFTPELHWRTGTDGNWDNRTNWTVGLNPAHVHPVFIDPDTDALVTGPNQDVTIDSLTIGGGTGQANLQLQATRTISINNGASVESNGTLSGNGTLAGSLTLAAGGSIAPGNSAGEITVDGDYTQSTGSTYEVELASAVDFDQVTITGTASLAGNVAVTRIADFVPDYGQEFQVMTFDSSTGAFDTITGASIDPDRVLAPILGLNQTTGLDGLTLVTAIPGDANLDGEVSIGDLSLLASHFGETPGGLGHWGIGDFNHDGEITIGDLSLLASHFGSTTMEMSLGISLESAAALVGVDTPEPNTLAAVAAATLLAATRRPRQPRRRSALS